MFIKVPLLSLLIICFSLLLSLSIIIHRRWFSPLRHYPGPFIASCTRLWYTYILWCGLQHVVLPRLHKQYGQYVRVAPNEIHISDPYYLKPIYGVGSRFRKSGFFRVFQGTRRFDLVSEQDPKLHSAQRRQIAQTYSMTAIRKTETLIDETILGLIRKLDLRLGQSLDISDWVQLWSFDTIGMMTFSRAFGFLESGGDWNGALSEIRRAMDSAAWVGQNPWFYFFCQKWIFPITGNLFALVNRHQSVRQFAVDRASERTASESIDRPDIMTGLLSVHAQNPTFDDESLKSMVTTNIFGGAETVASSLRAAIYYTLKSPAVKTELIREIDRHKKHLNKQSEVVISLDHCEKMEYLQAVILEAMRLFPASGIPSSRVVPETGTFIDGKLVPSGAEITIFPWSLHRDTDVFGPDADQFRPDRWLVGPEVEKLKRTFFSFGGGARSCIGRNIAWIEMTKCLATLFLRYEIKLADPEKDWVVEGSFIKSQRDINLVLQRR